MSKPALLVLAAGLGNRYGGLKQIEPIGPSGETLMDYSIFDAMRAGFGRVVFVIRRDIESAFRESVGARFEKRFSVEYVLQEIEDLPTRFTLPPHRTKPWGTGHAVLSAASAIHEPFAAINADDFYGANSFRALGEHLRLRGPDYAMVGFTLRHTLSEFGSVARGVCRESADGFLETVTEVTRIERARAGAKYTGADGQVHPLSGDELVSLNMWGFRPGFFSHLHERWIHFLGERGQDEKAEFYIPTVVNELVNAELARCKILRTADSWMGVTYREDAPFVRDKIRALIGRGDYPERLWG